MAGIQSTILKEAMPVHEDISGEEEIDEIDSDSEPDQRE